MPGTVLAMKDLVPGKPSIMGKHCKRRGFCVSSPSVIVFGLLLSRRGRRVLGQEVLIHPKGRSLEKEEMVVHQPSEGVGGHQWRSLPETGPHRASFCPAMGSSTEHRPFHLSPAGGGWAHRPQSPSAPQPGRILRIPNRFCKTLLASWLFATQLN